VVLQIVLSHAIQTLPLSFVRVHVSAPWVAAGLIIVVMTREAEQFDCT
jgi:hypothetical protein